MAPRKKQNPEPEIVEHVFLVLLNDEEAFLLFLQLLLQLRDQVLKVPALVSQHLVLLQKLGRLIWKQDC